MTDIPEFLFPRRLVRRAGATAEVGEALARMSVPRGTVVVVADRFIHEVGLTAALLSGLTDVGYRTEVFAEIAGEPELEMVERAVDAARALGAVAVIGIGGGSALDTAKIVAYACTAPTPLTDLAGPLPEIAGFPPLVLVPTTVGTGSETTRVAMLSVSGAKRIVTCPQFVPDLAVLDADLVEQLPAGVVASTALDALAHSIESMMSTTHNELSWTFSESAARMIFAELRTAVSPGGSAARARLLYAAFLAGIALNAGVVLGHSLSYILSGRLHLAHGVGCAIALPYCIAYNAPMDADAGAAIARAVLGDKDADLRRLAESVQQLATDVGVPHELASLGVDPEEAADLGIELVNSYPRPTNPLPLDVDRVGELIRHMCSGDLAAAWQAMEANR